MKVSTRQLTTLWVFAIAASCAVVSSAVAPRQAQARPKTDLIILNNGDHITCEIKEMSRGKVTAKTDAAGTIYVEWEDIVGIESQFYFRFESAGGRRVYGTPKLYEGEDMLRVRSLDTEVAIPKDRVVEIIEIERSFISALDGSLSFGFSYTKASDVAQMTFDWTTQYRTERNYWDLKLNSILTDRRDDSDPARRNDFSLGLTRLLSRQRWFGTVTGGVQRNDELGIARRLIGSVTTGYNPLKNNRNLWLFSLGVAINSENAVDSTGTSESLEGVLSTSYSLYVYNTPKRDISFNGAMYPSLTESERVRLHFDTKIRYELISDLFFDLSFYYDLDNQPPTGEKRALDYGIVTSVGWSY